MAIIVTNVGWLTSTLFEKTKYIQYSRKRQFRKFVFILLFDIATTVFALSIQLEPLTFQPCILGFCADTGMTSPSDVCGIASGSVSK